MVLPLYNELHLIEGTHLEDIHIKTQKVSESKSEVSKLKQNKLDRYHYIIFDDNISIPNSIIDFKHCFSVSLTLLEDNIDNRIGSIEELYREHISQRFCSFLSRIGLP